MMPQLIRVAKRDGKKVHWQNGLGGHLGQSGTFRFATESQAERFEAYATQDGAPGLSNVSLIEALGFGPINRETTP